MVTHVALGAETLTAALWALEGSLIDVDPHMDAKILFLTEGFATGWECTLVRLCSVMEM